MNIKILSGVSQFPKKNSTHPLFIPFFANHANAINIVMLRIFRQVALWEAISTIFLFFVAMPVKYVLPRFMEIPDDIRLGTVRIAGSIHGFLVVIFVVLLIACWQSYNWKFKRVVMYFAVSLFPVVSFWVERDVLKIINKEKI